MGVTDKTAYVMLLFGKNIALKIEQVYPPTESHAEEELECFYGVLEETMNRDRCKNILIGDFNAKIWIQ